MKNKKKVKERGSGRGNRGDEAPIIAKLDKKDDVQRFDLFTDDFEGVKVPEDWLSLDVLAETVQLATYRYQKRHRLMAAEKRLKHGFGIVSADDDGGDADEHVDVDDGAEKCRKRTRRKPASVSIETERITLKSRVPEPEPKPSGDITKITKGTRREPVAVSMESERITPKLGVPEQVPEPRPESSGDITKKPRTTRAAGVASSGRLPRANDMRLGQNEGDNDIPVYVKERIVGLGGTDILLVSEKVLKCSDVNTTQSRLLMPIESTSFLREDEREHLQNRVPGTKNKWNKISVPVLEPTLELCTLALGRWSACKSQETEFSCTLVKGWNGVVSRNSNELKEGTHIQVWSFRVGSKLHLALVTK